MLALVLLLSLPAEPLLAPRALASDDYAESYSFIGDLEDGSYVLLQLGVSNIGPGSGHGICRGLVIGASGAVWTENTIVDDDEWRHQAVGAVGERLSVGDCALEVDGDGTRITVVLDGSRVSLAFAAKPRVEHAPGARLALGGHHHVQALWLSAVPVRASILVAGAPPRTVAGVGYGDHAVSDADPDGVAARWIRFRALRARPPVLLQSRLAPDGARGPSWLRHGDTFRELGAVDTTRRGPRDAPLFTVRTGTITITAERFLYRYAPVEEIGLLGKLVSPFVGAPISYTARATLEVGGKKIPGLLEIELSKD